MKAALDAAITRVPRLLIADWITRLAILNTALWIPAGSPIRRIFRRQALSMDSLCKSRCTHFSVFVSLIKRMEELTILAITVAVATPFTFIQRTITKKRFKSTFNTPPQNRARRGVLVSPVLRKIAASKLKRKITGNPRR